MPKRDNSNKARDQVELYLKKIPEPFHSALQELRILIKNIAPNAKEVMIYGVPGFNQDGALVCYAAFKNHCGFYPLSPEIMNEVKSELKGFRTSEGTIQFQPNNPLTNELIKKIVLARIKQNEKKQNKNNQ